MDFGYGYVYYLKNLKRSYTLPIRALWSMPAKETYRNSYTSECADGPIAFWRKEGCSQLLRTKPEVTLGRQQAYKLRVPMDLLVNEHTLAGLLLPLFLRRHGPRVGLLTGAPSLLPCGCLCWDLSSPGISIQPSCVVVMALCKSLGCYHRTLSTGLLIKNKYLFLLVLEAESSRSKHLQIQCVARV